MKNLFNRTSSAAIALIALFTVSFTVPALAIDEKNNAAVELKFIGNLKNQPLFQLTFNSPEVQEFTVAVLDESNAVLYKDIIKGNAINKKFLLNTEELGDADIRFEITNRKTNKTTTYEINRNTRFVQDLVINKVN